MSDDQQIVEATSNGDSGFLSPTVNYVLYIVALVSGLPMLVGAFLAYIANPTDEIQKNHYRYQIRTFWLAVFYVVLAWALIISILGSPLGLIVIPFSWIFVLVRSIKGLGYINRNEPVPNVTTWLW